MIYLDKFVYMVFCVVLYLYVGFIIQRVCISIV